jgi:glycosyltransferase involved in cell wall biosynthesis
MNKKIDRLGKKYKIAFLVSHPIQYNSPLFEKLSKKNNIDLTVLYCSDESIKEMNDPGFGRKIKWDIPLLKGYRYKFLKNYSLQKTISKQPFGLINFGILKEISKRRYDVLIVHSRQYITHWFAFLTALVKGIPIFYRDEMPLNQELLISKWKIFVKKILLGTIFHRIHAFFAISSENHKFYQFYGADSSKIFQVPYAVDNDRFMADCTRLRKRKEAIRKEEAINQKNVVILFVGKLINKKRPFDLLKAYEKIKNNKKSLVYVGDGELKNKLQDYVKDKKIRNVHFLGFKNQTELSRYYSIADIFVLPSGRGETFGLVVNEAMCSSLPVLISNIPGAKDLVVNGKNGFIFNCGDINTIVKKLSPLISNEKLRKKMGSDSYNLIKKWNYLADIKGIMEAINSLKK